MSKAGKFVKKHPWEAAAIAAGTAIGGPAIAGMLGGGTAASGVAGAGAGLFGASDLTAALAGDAFMPAALGATGEGTASAGSLLGSKFASGSMANFAKNPMAKMAGKQLAMGLLSPQSPGMAPMGAPQAPPGSVTPTKLYADEPPPEIARDPRLLEMWKRQRQGGIA